MVLGLGPCNWVSVTVSFVVPFQFGQVVTELSKYSASWVAAKLKPVIGKELLELPCRVLEVTGERDHLKH